MYVQCDIILNCRAQKNCSLRQNIIYFVKNQGLLRILFKFHQKIFNINDSVVESTFTWVLNFDELAAKRHAYMRNSALLIWH